MSAAGEAAVVRECFREPHADAGAKRGSQSHGKSCMSAAGGTRGKSGGEYGGQRGDGAVHQSGKAWLHDLQYEETAISVVFLRARSFIELAAAQLSGAVLMLALFLRQIIEQLPYARVLHAVHGFFVKTAGCRIPPFSPPTYRVHT